MVWPFNALTSWNTFQKYLILSKRETEDDVGSQVLKEIKLLTNLSLKHGITKNIEIAEIDCSDGGDWRSAVSSMMLTRLTNMQWRRKKNFSKWNRNIM